MTTIRNLREKRPEPSTGLIVLLALSALAVLIVFIVTS